MWQYWISSNSEATQSLTHKKTIVILYPMAVKSTMQTTTAFLIWGHRSQARKPVCQQWQQNVTSSVKQHVLTLHLLQPTAFRGKREENSQPSAWATEKKVRTGLKMYMKWRRSFQCIFRSTQTERTCVEARGWRLEKHGMKLVRRKECEEQDKELKTNLVQHRNTTSNATSKKVTTRAHSQSTITKCLKIFFNLLCAPPVWNAVVFTKKAAACRAKGYKECALSIPVLLSFLLKSIKHLRISESKQDHFCVSQNVSYNQSHAAGTTMPASAALTNLFVMLKFQNYNSIRESLQHITGAAFGRCHLHPPPLACTEAAAELSCASKVGHKALPMWFSCHSSVTVFVKFAAFFCQPTLCWDFILFWNMF